MGNKYAQFKNLEKEYLRLLKIAPNGEMGIKFYESGSVPLEKLKETIEFLKNEIAELKKQLISDGIDIDNYLEKDILPE
jgi:hypothetical protein